MNPYNANKARFLIVLESLIEVGKKILGNDQELIQSGLEVRKLFACSTQLRMKY